MAQRLYIVPIIGEGTPEDPRTAKYFSSMTTWWGSIDFGSEPFMLVLAEVTPAEHSTISSYADVISIPADIDANITTAALPQVQNALESINVPALWVSTEMTYREVVHVVAAMFLFVQAVQGMTSVNLFQAGITLNTQFSDLPAEIRQAMLSAASSLQLDTSSLSASSTVRAIMREMAAQWGDRQIFLGGVAI